MIARHQQIQWYCVRTHMKREQMAAEHLRRLIGVEAFSPRLRYRKATARGRIWWVEPLFPGYILARFHLDEMKRQVNHCMGVRGIVHFGNTIPVIPEVAVESLRDEVLKRSATDTVTTTPTIVVGDEVEVADGPLRGMNGVVLNLEAVHSDWLYLQDIPFKKKLEGPLKGTITLLLSYLSYCCFLF